MKIKLILISIIVINLVACGWFKSADQLFAEAEEKRDKGDIRAAIELLETLVMEHKEHPKAAGSQYLIAEIYYRDLRDFKSAIKNYQKVGKLFPISEKIPFALFMCGYIYANMLSDFSVADTFYHEFLDQYPDHELAPSVKFELEFLGKDINEIPLLKHLNS